VFEDVKYRCDVLRDAGAEDAEDGGIALQLLDPGGEVLGHVLGDLGQTTAEACCHGRKQLIAGMAAWVHNVILSTAVPIG
jgi:hypothetical protein